MRSASDQWAAPADWVELPEPFVAKEGFFVTRVVGESMNRRIPNGAWCLFKSRPAAHAMARSFSFNSAIFKIRRLEANTP